ncbi:MAG: diflavin flavoprotein [Cyanobacteria bacterium P01_D01_bin.123]
MVSTPVKTNRLTTQVEALAADTQVLRSLDWDRDRFDIEFGLQNGTTYNSYLIRGEKTALIDTSHAKFRELYMSLLQEQVDLSQLDYLIISHTEPDHSGLVADILALAPHVTVVGAKVALHFLDDLVHQPYEKLFVKGGSKLDLGNGHELEFISAPNLHWPDTIFTYDCGTNVLYTCDAFGMHYCDDNAFDVDLSKIEPDYRFYYECLMAPNARSVLTALKRMDAIADGEPFQAIANGHGPILRYHITELVERYRTWSQKRSKADTTVAVFYVSDYGYSDRLSQSVAHGITKTGVAVEMMDLKAGDPQELQELVGQVQGLIVLAPPTSGRGAEASQAGLSNVLAAVNGKQFIGIVESYGGDDEPIDPLLNKFVDLGLTPGFKAIRVKDTPTEATYQLCEESGTDMGQELNHSQKMRKKKSDDNSLEKALGRVSSGLYIITAKKGEITSAMLASWVNQASFQPLGVSIAVAKDRAIESFMQVGDRFVLNVLEEGKHLKLMKQFLKRFPPGVDRFAGVDTQPASDGSPILSGSLAYMECQVVSRMETSDHWIVYSTVSEGKVANADGRTAAHYRKLGTYY